MQKCKIIARILETNHCQYLQQGQKFILDGFMTQGLCNSDCALLSRREQRLAPRLDSRLEAENIRVSVALPKACSDYWEIAACRAVEGHCSFALLALADLKEQLVQVVRESAWVGLLQKYFPGGPLPHLRLRVALAACPNACTQPQVRDVGLVACLRPTEINSDCNGCGRCVEVCQEQAVAVENDRAYLLGDRCVGCGLCVRECPQEAIQSWPVRFRVLLGGRLGRHPAWALELPKAVSPSQVCSVVQRVLSVVTSQARPREGFSTVVNRLGIEYLSEATKQASFSDE